MGDPQAGILGVPDPNLFASNPPTGVVTDTGGWAFNWKAPAYGAKGDGVTDDTSAISTKALPAAVAVHGISQAPPGTYIINSPLNPTGGVTLQGAIGGTILRAGTSWSGSQLLLINQNNTAVEGFYFQTGSSTTYSSNNAADVIAINGAAQVWIDRCIAFYQNGWFINATPNGGTNPFAMFFSNLYCASGAKGIHLNGTGAFSVGTLMTSIFMNHMQAGEALFIDSAHDVEVTNFFSVLDGPASSFSNIHLNDNCAGVYIIAADCGGIAGGAYTGTSYKIDHGAGTRANNVMFISGVTSAQGIGGDFDCDDFLIAGHTFLQQQTDGVIVRGSGNNINLRDVFIRQSNLAAGTAYDYHGLNAGRVQLLDCWLESTGTTAAGFWQGTEWVRGGGATGGVAVTANATPHFRNFNGYNPKTIAAPGVPATTVDYVNPFRQDAQVIITAGAGSTCVVKIMGVTVDTLAASAKGYYSLPDNQAINLTYTSAPTWTWSPIEA